MPREAPLAMPVQSLRQFSRSERRAWADPTRARTPWLERLFVFGGALALTVYGEREMYGVVEVGVITPLEWALVTLFVLTFSWICLAFTQCVLGFAWLVFRAPRPNSPAAHAQCQDRDRHADLQRGPGAGVRGDAGDLRGHRGDGPRRFLRLFLSRPTPPIPTSGSPRSGRCWRCASDFPRRVYSIADGERT